MSLLLTPEERKRFIAYCSQMAESTKLIIGQLETVPHAAPIVKAEKQKMAAYFIVAKDLSSVEDFTIDGDTQP